MPFRTTEEIARETLRSQFLDLMDTLDCPDNILNPWCHAEDQIREMLLVVTEVQKQIHARALKPALSNALHPALLPLMASVMPRVSA